MNLKLIASWMVISLLAGAMASHSQTTVNSDPVGFVTLNVTAGTGTTKRNTLLSLPLYDRASITGQSVGQITGVTSNTIVNSNAGWSPGDLSKPSEPYAIQITSGPGAGRIFLIGSSAGTGGALASVGNTSTTLTLVGAEVNALNNPVIAGVQAGHTYRIISVDTLKTAFPLSIGVRAGSSLTNSDSIQIVERTGSTSTYFFSSSLNRWTKQAFGNPDASNVPLPPFYGVLYQRLANTALSFIVSGTVPDLRCQVQVKNSGLTVLSQYWPTDSTLGNLNFQLIPGWKSAASLSTADIVEISSNGSTSRFWYNGTNWRRQAFGNPLADTTLIPVGTAVSLRKIGTATGHATYTNNIPYALNP